MALWGLGHKGTAPDGQGLILDQKKSLNDLARRNRMQLVAGINDDHAESRQAAKSEGEQVNSDKAVSPR